MVHIKYMMKVKNDYPSTHLLISLGPVLTVVVATNEPGSSLGFQIQLRFYEFSKCCKAHCPIFAPHRFQIQVELTPDNIAHVNLEWST